MPFLRYTEENKYAKDKALTFLQQKQGGLIGGGEWRLVVTACFIFVTNTV